MKKKIKVKKRKITKKKILSKKRENLDSKVGYRAIGGFNLEFLD